MYEKLFNPTTLYRCCAVLFLLFALGHTIGFLTLTPSSNEARDVFARMQSVRFTLDEGSYSYGDFYRGFGLFITLAMLMFAYLAAVLGQMAKQRLPFTAGIGWALAASQLAGFVLDLCYFSVVPTVFSLLLTILLAVAAKRSAYL